MIDYATYRRIHHLNEAETLNVAQIAERLALDPRTVRYWLDEPTFRPRQTAPRPSKLDPYKPLIRQWLEHYPYSGTQIFQRLGMPGTPAASASCGSTSNACGRKRRRPS